MKPQLFYLSIFHYLLPHIQRSFSGQSSQKPADSPLESGQSFIKILFLSLPHCLHYFYYLAAFTLAAFTLAAFTLAAFNFAAFTIFNLAVLAAFNFANNKIEGSEGEGSKNNEGSKVTVRAAVAVTILVLIIL